MNWRFALLPVVLLIAVLAVPCTAAAQVQISASSSTEVEFPNSMTFNLRAESTAPVTQAFLNYSIDKIATVAATTVIELEFEPTSVVVTSWTWEMKRMLGSLPPGAEVRYNWLIRDTSGHELQTAWRTVEFADSHHSWSTVAGENITLFWYDGDLAFGQTLLDAAEDALDTLSHDAGAELQQKVEVYAYASTQDLHDAMLFPQEWMGGAAFPEYGTLAVEADLSDLASAKRDIAHEMAHLVTYQMTFNPYSDIPTWLDEGLSMYAEGDLSGSFQAALNSAVAQNRLLSVETLSSSFPADIEQARLSYAESYSIVSFLIHQFGRDKMRDLLETFKQGSTYDQALLEVYSVDTAGLDNLWRASLGLEPGQSPAPPQTSATPDSWHIGCRATPGEPVHISALAFGVVALLLMPAVAQIIYFRTRRGKK